MTRWAAALYVMAAAVASIGEPRPVALVIAGAAAATATFDACRSR